MTTTREDREAACESVYGSLREEWSASIAEYAARGDDAGLLRSDAVGRDKTVRRASEFAAHREASTQALREAAERLCAEIEQDEVEDLDWDDVVAAKNALRSALSPSPAQGGARHAWAPGQNARCVVGGNFYTVGRVYPVLAVYLDMITIVDDSGQELQVLADRFEPDPRDLVLVRKAKP